jgi:hypothetical protein
MFTVPLHSKESYSIVACIFVAAGMCLPSRCLTMDLYCDFAIRAFGRHVAIYLGQKELPTTVPHFSKRMSN